MPRPKMGAMFDKISKFISGLGASGEDESGGQAAEPVAYKDFLIRPAPRRDGSHWHIAGSIVSEADPDGAAHEYIRADTFTSLEEAVRFTVIKGQQIIDERGKKLLD